MYAPPLPCALKLTCRPSGSCEPSGSMSNRLLEHLAISVHRHGHGTSADTAPDSPLKWGRCFAPFFLAFKLNWITSWIIGEKCPFRRSSAFKRIFCQCLHFCLQSDRDYLLFSSHLLLLSPGYPTPVPSLATPSARGCSSGGAHVRRRARSWSRGPNVYALRVSPPCQCLPLRSRTGTPKGCCKTYTL